MQALNACEVEIVVSLPFNSSNQNAMAQDKVSSNVL